MNDFNSSRSQDAVFSVLEKFICHLYSMPGLESVDEARFEIFKKTFKVKNVNEPFNKKFRNIDATSLPPCKSELLQQLLRSHYICHLWRNAHLKNPTELRPEDYGWIEDEGRYKILWFKGEQLPTLVADVMIQPTRSEDDINVTGM